MTDIARLPFRSTLAEYQRQAEELLEAWKTGDPGAIQLLKTKHPRFLDDRIQWLSKNPSDAEVRCATLALEDFQLATARWYDLSASAISPLARKPSALFASFSTASLVTSGP